MDKNMIDVSEIESYLKTYVRLREKEVEKKSLSESDYWDGMAKGQLDLARGILTLIEEKEEANAKHRNQLKQKMDDLDYKLGIEIDAREYAGEDGGIENLKAIENLKGQQRVAEMVLKIIKRGERG